MLAYYLHLDEFSVDPNALISNQTPLEAVNQNLQVSRDSFRNTVLKSELAGLQSAELEENEENDQKLPSAAKSFYENTSDDISFEDFANFLTYYPTSTKLLDFLSAGSGFSDHEGNSVPSTTKQPFFSNG